jgi:uncharacterized membrane protein
MTMGDVKILYAGDGETMNYLVTKGLNFYMAGGYMDESGYLRSALESDHEISVTHIKPGESLELFPRDMDALRGYGAVILSDIGADSILFYMNRDIAPMGPNRLRLLKQYVLGGGGLIMIGGWSSFGGWGGQARWSQTPVEDVLPVIIKDGDDRVEVPEGCSFERWNTDHPITRELPVSDCFVLTGYNRIKAKLDATVLAWIGEDPAVVVGLFGKGRSIAVATDCAPHWAGTWLNWPGYNRFWTRCVKWAASNI